MAHAEFNSACAIVIIGVGHVTRVQTAQNQTHKGKRRRGLPRSLPRDAHDRPDDCECRVQRRQQWHQQRIGRKQRGGELKTARGGVRRGMPSISLRTPI